MVSHSCWVSESARSNLSVCVFQKCSPLLFTGCQILISYDLDLFLLRLFIACVFIIFYLCSLFFLAGCIALHCPHWNSLPFFLITSSLTLSFPFLSSNIVNHRFHIDRAIQVSNSNVKKQEVSFKQWQIIICWCFSELIPLKWLWRWRAVGVLTFSVFSTV